MIIRIKEFIKNFLSWRTLCLGGIIFGIFCIRILYLDSDIPPWGVVHYQPIDEGSYSLMALNKIDYNTVNPSNIFDGQAPFVAPQLRNNLIGNTLTYLTLKLFGDNYYGLRMPNIIFCAILIMLTVAIMNKFRMEYGKNKKNEKIFLFLLSLSLVFDFYLSVSSRVSENSMLRAVFVVITIYIFNKFDEKKLFWKYFLITLVTTLSVFMVYITNTFLYLAIAMILLYEIVVSGKKEFFKGVGGCVAGGFLGLGLSEIYYMCVWKTGAIKNALATINDFLKGNVLGGYEQVNSSYLLYNRVVNFISSNILLYNLPIIILTLIILPIIIYRLTKFKERKILYLLFIIVALFLQTLFAEDLIMRKFLVIYPVILIVIYVGYLLKDSYFIALRYIQKKWLRRLCEGVNIFYVLVSFFIVYKIFSFRMYGMTDGTLLDYNSKDVIMLKLSIFACGMLSMLTFLVVIMLRFKKRRESISVVNGGIYCIVIFTIGLNIFLNYEYIYKKPTFSEKQVMIDLKDIVGDDYVVGEYQNGFLLYNDMKSVPLETYEKRKQFLEKHPESWYFDYYFTHESRERYFNTIPLKDSKYTGVPMYTFQRKTQSLGDKRAVSLYKIKLKDKSE